MYNRYKLPLSEAEKYIDRITEADDRFELYMELSLYRKAADTATRMKDPARLQEVLKLSPVTWRCPCATTHRLFVILMMLLFVSVLCANCSI